MAISDWPEDERPREKLLAYGPQSLSDAELLAIFLRTGVRGKTAVDLARELILSFGGIRAILEADLRRFCQPLGLGTAKFAQLQATLEMARRHLAERMIHGAGLNEPGVIREYLTAKLRAYRQEVFACIYLDSKHRMLLYHQHFFGGINEAVVYPRELVKSALHTNAAAVILAHNHPSGIAEPSAADLAITRRIQLALELIDVRVVDHMIVGEGEIFSFAEGALL